MEKYVLTCKATSKNRYITNMIILYVKNVEMSTHNLVQYALKDSWQHIIMSRKPCDWVMLSMVILRSKSNFISKIQIFSYAWAKLIFFFNSILFFQDSFFIQFLIMNEFPKFIKKIIRIDVDMRLRLVRNLIYIKCVKLICI